MTAWYNEIDPDAAAILRQLIADDIIAPGDVDTRSIKDVKADDIRGYDQCHFFAGGGLWSVAARLAGWPDNRPLWSGSCPCQPHSTAAADKRLKFRDDRDLWPAWDHLIGECRPDVVAGEQVDDNAAWIDRVLADLEAKGYAVGALDLPTCAVDAPQIRMRTFIMADTNRSRLGEQSRAVTVVPQQFPPERSGRGSRYGRYATAGELGRTRRIEPGIRLLADDVPGRVAILRVGGNAINPELAAQVLGAYMDCCV